MWTPTTRRQHSRAGLRYETDLTDAEWAVIAPLMPDPAPCGRPRVWTTREILNAIFYVLRGGIAWRLIPKDLPPRSTTFGDFSRWRDEGVFARINHIDMDEEDRATPQIWLGGEYAEHLDPDAVLAVARQHYPNIPEELGRVLRIDQLAMPARVLPLDHESVARMMRLLTNGRIR